MKITIVLIALVLIGCAAAPAIRSRDTGTGDQAFWNDARCYDLLTQRDGFGTAAKFLVAVGGAGALTTPAGAAIDNERDRARMQWAIGVSAAVISSAGLAALWLAEIKSTELERYCETSIEPETIAAVEVTSDLGATDVEFIEADGGL